MREKGLAESAKEQRIHRGKIKREKTMFNCLTAPKCRGCLGVN